MCICICIFMYVCMYIHIYIYIYDPPGAGLHGLQALRGRHGAHLRGPPSTLREHYKLNVQVLLSFQQPTLQTATTTTAQQTSLCVFETSSCLFVSTWILKCRLLNELLDPLLPDTCWSHFYIPQRGVQWKQGVVIYMTLHTSYYMILPQSTAPPIRCTPPLRSIHQ